MSRSFVLALVSLAGLGGACKHVGTLSAPGLSVTVSAATASVAQGASTQLTATVTGLGGFNGTPSLAASGAPTGVTVTIATPQTGGNITTATVTIAATSGGALGNSTLTITASGTGVAPASTTVALTVTAPPALYTLSVLPNALTVTRGSNGGTTVTLLRDHFTGNVMLSAENLIAGVTAAFVPNPATGGSSILTLTAVANATLASVPVTIRGTAAGLSDRTATLSLTTTSPGPVGTIIQQIANESWVHVPEGSAINYANNPPASGPHYPVWLRWEAFTTAMARGYWVHNVEHGGIVMLYRPDTPPAVIAALTAAFNSLPVDPECGHPRALITPDPLLPSTRIAVVAANWLLTADGVDQPSILSFVQAHRNHGNEMICLTGNKP